MVQGGDKTGVKVNLSSKRLCLEKYRPSVNLTVYFGLPVPNGQCLSYLTVSPIVAPTKYRYCKLRHRLIRVALGHVIAKGRLLGAVSPVSKMLVKTVPYAPFGLTDVHLRW